MTPGLVAVDLAVTPELCHRRTSSWRRSGLKLLTTHGGDFRFLFSDLIDDHPHLFTYSSETGGWSSEVATESHASEALIPVFLCATDLRSRSVVVSTGDYGAPVVVRPGFAAAKVRDDRLHVYGDGHGAVVQS